LQIVSQNESHISIIIPCSNSIIDESRNVFKIESPYDLNCNETKIFGYIDKFTIWWGDKCCGKHSNWPDSQKNKNHSVELKEYSRCGWCRHWCRVSVICVIPITNYCKTINIIKNVESNSVGVKSLSGSCDIQVEDKMGYRFYISWMKGPFQWLFKSLMWLGHRRFIY
jgi:hypothetical protein